MSDICRSCLPGGFCCGEEGDDFGFSAEWLKCTALVTPEKKLIVWCHGQSSSVCTRSSFLQVWSLKISPRWRHPATLHEPAMGKCSSSLQGPCKVTGGAGKAGWQAACTQISWAFFLCRVSSSQRSAPSLVPPKWDAQVGYYVSPWGQDPGFSTSNVKWR